MNMPSYKRRFLETSESVSGNIKTEFSETDHRYADAPQDLYVYLADRDVPQSREARIRNNVFVVLIKTYVIN